MLMCLDTSVASWAGNPDFKAVMLELKAATVIWLNVSFYLGNVLSVIFSCDPVAKA